MRREVTHAVVPSTPASLGGIALLLLLAVAAAMPEPRADRAMMNLRGHEAPRAPMSVRGLSGAMARAVRDLVGGSVVAATARVAAALASAGDEGAQRAAPQREDEPALSTCRPETLDLPPPSRVG